MPYDENEWESLREKIIGLGERSLKKSYYPELQERLDELERFKTLLNHSKDSIFLLKVPEDHFIDLNLSASQMLGYSREEILKKSLQEILAPSEHKVIGEWLKNMVNNHDIHLKESISTYFQDNKGTYIPVEISASIVEFSHQLYLVLVVRDITERMIAEEKIKASLKEKEVLLREIHHRVKNNLQIISSLLSLQSAYVDDDKSSELFQDSQNRIKSMALIHEELYQSKNLDGIDSADYIQRMVANLFHSFSVDPNRISTHFELDEIFFNIETSIPCGLIITELVTNALKYAFPDDRKGEITIKLKKLDDRYLLIISDNGVGIPDKYMEDNVSTFGLILVRSLVKQLDGKLEIRKNKGTEFRIKFKPMLYKDRF